MSTFDAKSGASPAPSPPAAAAPATPGRQTLAGEASAESSGTAGGGMYSAPSVFANAGAPLPTEVKSKFEASLGTDLSPVRVHADADAGREAARHGAVAFATGNNIAVDPGHYDPSSPKGQQLLAEEVAHTVQQRGATPVDDPKTTSPSDGAETEAKAAASSMVAGGTAQVSSQPMAIARSTPAPAGPVTPPPPPNLAVPPNAAEADKPKYNPGHKIGHWAQTATISVGKFLGFFESEAEALATAHSMGAVVCVNARWEAYNIAAETSWLQSFYYENVKILNGASQFTTVFIEQPFTAVTTLDAVVLRSVYYNPAIAKQNMTPELMLKPGESPFGGFQKVFGNEKKQLGDDELIAAFTAAMKRGAFDVLRQSEAEVEKKRDQFKYKKTSGDEFKTIRQVATKLVQKDAEIAKAVEEAEPPLKEPKEHEPIADVEARRQARKRAESLREQKQVVLQEYPMLARQDPKKIQNASDDQISKLLGDDTIQILKDITIARDDLLTGDLDLWGLPSVINTTIAGCGIQDQVRRDKIKNHAAKLKKEHSIKTGIKTAFSIGLGLLATFSTGGLALVAAAGALGLSTYDAMEATKNYAVGKAASNTALDPNNALGEVPEDWKWVALAWVGVGMDIGSVAAALKGVKSIGEVAKAAEQLGKGTDDLIKKLKTLAGIVKDGEVITETTRGVIGLRLGAAVEIKQGLGTEIRVLYEVDEQTGRVFVKGVHAGAEATVKDILKHSDTVKLLNRYEGVTGSIREVVERFISIAPTEAKALEQFPKGSRAYESYLEVQKLKKIVKARLTSLEKGAGQLTADAEEALRRDIAFLEDELKRHQEVVDGLAFEKGSGFIAKGEHATEEAIKKKGWPDFRDPQYGIPPKDYQYYYYRRTEGGGFELCTKMDAPAEVKRLSVVEQGGKKTIIEGRKPPTLTFFGPNDVDAAFLHLKTNSESFKNYYPLFEKAGVSEAAMKAKLKDLLKNGELPDELLRGALKDHFRNDVLKWVKDESRLKKLYGGDPLWKSDPQAALRKYSHKELMENTKKLDNKDASRLEELWYSDPAVNPQMAGALEKQTGVMIGDKLRVPDNICKNGEIVDVKGGASLYDWDQITGYLSRVGKETTTQSGHVFTPKTVRIAALSPEGVKANAHMMRQYLDKGLVVEIYNIKSERKLISAANAAELEDSALLAWLYPKNKNLW